MWNAWGIAWGDNWGTSWGPLHEVEDVSLGGRDKLKRRDVQSRVVAALSVTDDSDTLLAAVHIEQAQVLALVVTDQEDAVMAMAAVYWQEAQMVIDRARLIQAPKVALIKSRYEAATI